MSRMRVERASGVALPFLTATLIWGSTWLAIKYQLGVVAPEVSVVYRFAAAGAMLLGFCLATGRPLGYSTRDHAFLALQGILFFGLNYVAIYAAEQYVTSGLVAVLFSTIVFMNPLGMRIAFGAPLTLRMLVAATLGVAGVALLFLPEIAAVREGGDTAFGILLALIGTAFACGGNLVAVRNQRVGIAIHPSNAWGMLYGAGAAAIAGLARGVEWTFDTRLPYLLSLGYLVLAGSIAAFSAYLILLKRVGAGPAAFVGITTPIIALVLSTLFEGYRWTGIALCGVLLALAGNVLALRLPAASR
jgi:drug/metabolite transporter (DMT)-like permease